MRRLTMCSPKIGFSLTSPSRLPYKTRLEIKVQLTIRIMESLKIRNKWSNPKFNAISSNYLQNSRFVFNPQYAQDSHFVKNSAFIQNSHIRTGYDQLHPKS